MHPLFGRLVHAAALAALAILAATAVALGQDREDVIITDTLTPQRLEVAAGTVVTWRNEDGERHRVRSRQGPVAFDSGNLEPGEQFSLTFVVAGEYPYLDERNDEDPAYFGTVVVTDDQPAGGPPPTEATVTLIDESFQPSALEVAVGATVTWENIDGDDDHTVTSTDGDFNSGVLPAGAAFEHSFDTPGTFPYFCAIHPEMEGTITVVGEAPAVVATPVTEDVPAVGMPAAVQIVDLTYQPATIEVDVGSEVTWTNDDSVPHTVTAREDDFNSGVLQGGEAYSQVFEEPGTYPYFCAIHPSMSGSVVVREAGAPAGTSDATGSGTADTDGTATEVSVVDVAFQPADIEVSAGTAVEWTNDDPFAHTVTATDGTFDSGTMGAGETFSTTFDEPGTYPYVCAIHPSMTGTVTVTP